MGIRYVSHNDLLCPIVFCDRCGQRIERGKEGRVLYQWHMTKLEQVGDSRFFHGGCVPPRPPWPTAEEIGQGRGVAEFSNMLDNFCLSLAWNHNHSGPGLIGLMARLFECDPPKKYDRIGDIPRSKRGIYILYNEEGIKYVGQSKVSIRKRLEQHKSTHHFSLNDIVQVTVIDVPTGKNKRESLEAALIWLLNPTFNIQWKRQHVG